MKRKGQIVRLKNRDTDKVIEVKVVQHDSIQGYWGEEFLEHYRNWEWYPPTEWEEIK